MTYVRQNWVDNDSTTPLSASRLNHIEDGIEQVNDKTTPVDVADSIEAAILALNASNLPFNPVGTIASNTIQGAIAEVAAEAGGGGGGSTNDQTVYAADYGVVGDNASDSTTELQAAIDAFGTTATARAGKLQLPRGTILISSTILIERKAIELHGYGWGPTGTTDGTTFRWVGAAGSPMFQCRQAMGTTFNNLRIMGSKTATPSAGIDFNVDADTQQQPNTFGTFDRVWFGPFTGYDEADLPGSANYLTTGWSTSGSEPAEDNLQNDMMRFSGCVFFKCGTGYKTWSTPPGNTQAVINKIQSCFFYYCDTGVDSIAQTMLDNVYFAHSSTTDLHIREDRFTCLNYTSEYAARLAILENNSELIVHTGYFQIGTETHADGKIIYAVNDTRTLIDISFFDFRENADYATSHVGVPAKISIKALNTGTLAHKNLGLHHVNWGIGGLRQAITASHLDIDPGMAGSGLDDLTIYGEVQGTPDASGSGITIQIYNYLHWKNPTADFSRNDRIVPLRVKAGIPADADYLNPPPNGTEVIDSTNNRLYMRVGGAWKYTALT